MIRIVLYYDRRSYFFFYKNTEIIVINTLGLQRSESGEKKYTRIYNIHENKAQFIKN